MDPLSDLLRVTRLTGAHFFPTAASGPWAVEVPVATALSPRILPGSEHLVPYHLVLSGQCWGGLTGEPLHRLESGDVILFPQGNGHVMSGRPMPGAPDITRVGGAPRFPDGLDLARGAHPDVTLICGFFGCALGPFNPLCAALPPQLVMRGMSDGVVGLFAKQVVEEARARRAGVEPVLARMAELMFIEVLRRYLDALPEESSGWLAGVRDPLVGRVLTLLHARPSHDWTLAGLASEAATSRSKLAERFSRLVGLAPMRYLAQWRMQVAAEQLAETGAKVAAVAAAVGYDSEAAFSRAFKKATGCSPGGWRSRRRAAIAID